MKLDAYLLETQTSPADFAALIGVSAVSVSRYASGKRMPRRGPLQEIVRVTGGRVTANDFMPAAPSGALPESGAA